MIDARSNRYDRQEAFAPLGPDGQEILRNSSALVVGVGGLGSWMAELLTRAGVARLRLVDDDVVDWSNLHRQAMYTRAHAQASTPKAAAATARLGEINDAVTVEPVIERLTPGNIDRLAGDVDVILDGTDNFATRFVLNDYAVRESKPWVFAGAAGGQGQVLAIHTPATPCLRCIYESPPPAELELNAQTIGILGPVVSAMASIASMEAIKLLAGRPEAASPYLLKLDFWDAAIQRVHAGSVTTGLHCPCCTDGRFEFLEG